MISCWRTAQSLGRTSLFGFLARSPTRRFVQRFSAHSRGGSITDRWPTRYATRCSGTKVVGPIASDGQVFLPYKRATFLPRGTPVPSGRRKLGF